MRALFVLLFLSACIAFAQPSRPDILTFPNDPVGTCIPQTFILSSASQTLFYCRPDGSWQAVSGTGVTALAGLGAAGGEVQYNCTGANKGKLCNDGADFIYDPPSHTLTLAELFTGGVLGGLYLDGLGADVASAAVIAMPTNTVFRVTGTAAINTITPVSGCIQPSLTNNSGCRIVMVPTGAWTTTTAGNIATAITATVGVPVIATYLNSTTKWYITSGTGQFGSNMTSVGGVGDVDTAKILSRDTNISGIDTYIIPSSASGTAYTYCPAHAWTAYTPGQRFVFLPDVASGAAPVTLNLCTLGPITLVKNLNGTLTNVTTNDLTTTTPYVLIATGNPVSGFEVVPSNFAAGANPAGSGSEIQIRSTPTTLAALTNSSSPNAGEIQLNTTPTASATRSVVTLGGLIAGGNAGASGGTYLGGNSAAGFNGAYWRFERNGGLWGQLYVGTNSNAAIGLNGAQIASSGIGSLFFADVNGNNTCCSLNIGENTLEWTANTAGVIANYGAMPTDTTQTNGAPSEPKGINLTTQAAAIANTTALFTPACPQGRALCEVRVTYTAKVTRAATNSSILGGTVGFQFLYTDGDDSVAQTATLPEFNEAGANIAIGTGNTGNATTSILTGTGMFNVKNGVATTYGFGYSSTGVTTMQFSLHVTVEVM